MGGHGKHHHGECDCHAAEQDVTTGQECECGDESECECGCGHSEEECDCECGCQCGHGDEGELHLHRRFTTRAERIARLEEYLTELKTEAEAVEERIAELKAAGAK